MSTKNENEMTKKRSKFVSFLMNHKLVILLLLVLVGVFLWAKFKMYSMENRFEKQTAEMKISYDNKIDVSTAKQLELTSKVFAWAIRSELTRDNKEQANQFFLTFIKEPGVIEAEYVDAATARVSLYTDKKDESVVFTNQDALLTDKTRHFTNDSVLTVMTPVMGLNEKIGVLVIKYKR